LAPEWKRYYTTMHPDDAAEWEADICSAEAALSHAKQAEAHAEAVKADAVKGQPPLLLSGLCAKTQRDTCVVAAHPPSSHHALPAISLSQQHSAPPKDGNGTTHGRCEDRSGWC